MKEYSREIKEIINKIIFINQSLDDEELKKENIDYYNHLIERKFNLILSLIYDYNLSKEEIESIKEEKEIIKIYEFIY